jgi:hypothetical protein
MLLAHFTPAEIPGTVAVLLVGVLLGASIAIRSLRGIAAAFAVLAAFATLASIADSQDWSGTARTAIDVGFLIALLPALALSVRWGRSNSSSGDSASEGAPL